MDPSILRAEQFGALGAAPQAFAESVARWTAGTPGRLLDVGSGSGEMLVALSVGLRGWQLLGVDLSESNTAAARGLAEETATPSQARFETASYPFSDGHDRGRFDVILAQSVLHFLTAPDEDLLRSLGSDLSADGHLIATLPYDCAYNRVLWSLRRVLRLVRCGATDRLIERTARLVHRDVAPDLVRQRVIYMYLLPTRIDGKRFRAAMKEWGGLLAVHEENLPATSVAQLRHRLVVFAHAPS